MFIASLSSSGSSLPLHPLLQTALDAIGDIDQATATPGVSTLIENDLILMINRATLKRPEEARLEAHRDMIDLHVPLSGPEIYAWKPLVDLTAPAEPYQTAKDARHYLDAADTYFTLKPGQFALFYPEDAHAACIGAGELLKIVVKIRTRPRRSC